jgi:translocation and assembly module TamA
VDNLLHPQSGFLLDGALSATPGGLLSSTHFVRAYGRGVAYWTPWPAVWGTWLARVELGQVWAGDLNQVPASQLFRAGGVNSVRGYDYQSLGVAANGAIVGGAVLATSSLEYQIPLIPGWALALFTDAGDAAQNWQSFQLRRSRGIGVRWFSPVAPFSLDIAQAQQEQRRLSIHMSLGLAF